MPTTAPGPYWGFAVYQQKTMPTPPLEPIEFEKDPVEMIAIRFGYSREAAESYYAAYKSADWKDYDINGVLYRARTRPEASQQHFDKTGLWPPLWRVIETY